MSVRWNLIVKAPAEMRNHFQMSKNLIRLMPQHLIKYQRKRDGCSQGGELQEASQVSLSCHEAPVAEWWILQIINHNVLLTRCVIWIEKCYVFPKNPTFTRYSERLSRAKKNPPVSPTAIWLLSETLGEIGRVLIIPIPLNPVCFLVDNQHIVSTAHV